MRLTFTLLAAAGLTLAALPAAAQTNRVQQAVNAQHTAWHRAHDRDRYRDPGRYERDHAALHDRLNNILSRSAQRDRNDQYRRNGNYGNYGGYYPSQQPARQDGYYDQNGRFHRYPTQGGYYDQYGNWHPSTNGGYYPNGGNYPNGGYYPNASNSRGRNPKAEGRHDNGKHKGWYKNGKAGDDRDYDRGRGRDRDRDRDRDHDDDD